MAAKVLAQIIVQATAVLSRAVVQAYGQALSNAKKGAQLLHVDMRSTGSMRAKGHQYPMDVRMCKLMI